MDQMAVPRYDWWFFCMSFVWFILNKSVDPSIGNSTMTPLMMSYINCRKPLDVV